jgi:hypothetical protein
MMARRNPSKRSRLTPGEHGELASKKESLGHLREWALEELADPIVGFCFDSRQNEQSWSNIRKAVKFAVARLMKQAAKKYR